MSWLEKLEVLHLSLNEFSGSLPEGLANLTTLADVKNLILPWNYP
eukprot:gene9604-10615_t